MMLMMLRGLIIVLLFVLYASGQDQPSPAASCDPFAKYTPTLSTACKGSSLDWYGDNEGLHLEAVAGCDQSRPENGFEIAVKLTPTDGRVNTMSNFYFEYSIEWLSDEANCIVDVMNISSDPQVKDQNGLTNSPLEDLSQYAVGKVYKRSFLIDGTIEILNFENAEIQLICAPRSNSTVRALVTSISLLKKDLNTDIKRFIYHKSACSDCSGSTYAFANCTAIEGYTRPQWIVNGTLNEEVLYIPGGTTLFVFGDLRTDRIVLGHQVRWSKIVVNGCVRSISGNPILFEAEGQPNLFTIQFKSGCAIPPVVVYNTDYRVTYESDHIDIDYLYIDGASPNDQAYADKLYRETVLITVFVVFGIAALIVGLAVGLHFHCKKERTKQQIQKMQQQELL